MYADTIDKGIDTLLADMRSQFSEGVDVGSTVSLVGKEFPTTGYMVGGYVDSLIFGKELLNHGNVAWDFITRFVSMHFSFATSGKVFLGGWLDTADGNIYIDLSFNFPDKEIAMQEARNNGEIAIWDLAKGEEIRLS
jgi:hypothetical protein